MSTHRSILAQSCVDRIDPVRQENRLCIEACSYVVGFMEKNSAKFSEEDEREVCSYVLCQMAECMTPKGRKSIEPVCLRLQALCRRRIERFLLDDQKPDPDLTRYWAAKEERSPFAHACVQYIASVAERRVHLQAQIAACDHVLSILEKPADPITEWDKLEICGYMMRSFLFSNLLTDQLDKLTRPLHDRIQALTKARLERVMWGEPEGPPKSEAKGPNKEAKVERKEAASIRPADARQGRPKTKWVKFQG